MKRSRKSRKVTSLGHHAILLEILVLNKIRDGQNYIKIVEKFVHEYVRVSFKDDLKFNARKLVRTK